jgi:hypothetical protein
VIPKTLKEVAAMFIKHYASLVAAVFAATLSLSPADAAVTVSRRPGVTQVIPMSQVPWNVRNRIRAEAGGRRIVRVERVRRRGPDTFRAVFAGRRSIETVHFSSRGSVIRRSVTRRRW